MLKQAEWEGKYMERVRRQIGAQEAAYTGKGIHVAVLDSGVENHPDLRGRILTFRDFVGGGVSCYDDNGHGTHICGVICGSGRESAGKYRGLATDAGLVVGKVLDRQGNGKTEQMLEGLEWIRRSRERLRIRILNISVGIGELDDLKKEKALCDSLEQLWNDGITVICAAGNRGPAAGSLSALGKSEKIITVGCHDGEFRSVSRPCRFYSGRGLNNAGTRYKPDLVAPGTDIVSCNAGYRNGLFYIAKSGTSMATPIVSAAAALLLEQNPQLSNEEVKRRLSYTADDLREDWNLQGWGMVNIKKLLEKY